MPLLLVQYFLCYKNSSQPWFWQYVFLIFGMRRLLLLFRPDNQLKISEILYKKIHLQNYSASHLVFGYHIWTGFFDSILVLLFFPSPIVSHCNLDCFRHLSGRFSWLLSILLWTQASVVLLLSLLYSFDTNEISSFRHVWINSFSVQFLHQILHFCAFSHHYISKHSLQPFFFCFAGYYSIYVQ